MSDMPATTRTLPGSLARRLAALRRGLVRWFLADAAAGLAVAALALVLGSFAVDRTMRMDRPQRAVCLALGASVLAVLAWRRLGRPMRTRLSDDALGRLIEARHGELGERFVSAVDLARLADPQRRGYSAAFVRATVAEGVRAAEGVDVRDVLDARARRRNLAVAFGAVALVAVGAAAFPETARLWFRRNVLLAQEAWPQKTHLDVRGAEACCIVMARGDDLVIEVEADPGGVVPDVVMLDYRPEGGATSSEPMVITGDAEFTTTFRSVLEPLRFRARGGDAETPWHEVRLVDRPAVEALELRATPPEYTGREPRPLASNVGIHAVLAGSTLRLEGRATKDLAEADLAFGREAPRPLQRTGPRDFAADLPPETLRDGTYAITLVDTAGFASGRPARFSVKIVPDRAPTARAGLDGIGDLIVPVATVPLRCTVRDDHAVERAELVFAALGEQDAVPAPSRAPLAGTEGQLGGKEVETVHRLEAAPLALAPGDHLVVHVEAWDNDTVSGPKVGRSGNFSLRVVSEAEMRADLLRREQEQRLELERLLRDQRKLLEDSRALAAALARGDPPDLTGPERDTLAGAERRQRLVGGRCTAVARAFGQILDEVRNNHLDNEGGALHARLEERIIVPLDTLARRQVLTAADHLDLALKALKAPGRASGDVTEMRERLAAAATEQEAATRVLAEVLRHMVKWEGYQEAVRLLRDVLRTQKDVNEETVREYERRIRRLFDD